MDADPQVVEELIARISGSFEGGPNFSPAEGLSAAVTFAYRFAATVIKLSPEDNRTHNAEIAIQSLKKVIGMLELDALTKKETVH